MKTKLWMLVLALCAAVWAPAQTGNKTKATACTTVTKEDETGVKLKSCMMVPRQVCRITSDRRHVACYITYDGEDYTPYNGHITYYGPTGPMPGARTKFETETIIVKKDRPASYCTRNEEEKTTTCYYTPAKLCRDSEGYYSYCQLPRIGPPAWDDMPDNNVVHLTGTTLYR